MLNSNNIKKAALVKDRNGFWRIFKPVLEEQSYEVSVFDLRFDDEQKRLLESKWDAFIWRAKHTPKERIPAKRFISLMSELGVNCYPDWKSYSHYDDKIAQSYLMMFNRIPVPETYVFYDKDTALNFASATNYPLIYKSTHGAGSANVGLLENKKKALKYIKKVFGKGMKTFFASDYQRDYVYLQEFAEGNEGDFRLVCFDNNIEGFFRNNRKDKPFASGSHDFNLNEIPLDLLDFVYEINENLGYDVMSYDIIKSHGKWVIAEISVVYGDLKDEIYNRSLMYYRDELGRWSNHSPAENHHVRVLKSIIKKWKTNAS